MAAATVVHSNFNMKFFPYILKKNLKNSLHVHNHIYFVYDFN